MKKKLLWGLLAILVGIQFIRPEQTNPPIEPGQDILSRYPAQEEVSALLKAACYDCHSHETQWPWYSHINPMGWVVSDHVAEGREELNFSAFAGYSPKKADHKLEESVEYIKKGEMPLKGYTLLHADARLDEAQKALLLNWLMQVREEVGYAEE